MFCTPSAGIWSQHNRDTSAVWLITDADPEHPGKHVARAHVLDHQGGRQLPGALVADTLAGLREQMPAGLEITSVSGDDVLEVWD